MLNHNLIPEVDEPDRLLSHTDLQNESLYFIQRAGREILAQDAEIRKARTQALEDHNGNDSENLDEDSEIEDGESELDRKLAQLTEYLS